MKKLISRITYYFHRLFDMDFKSFFKEINTLHKISGKSRVFLFFDIILSSIRYGAGYVEYSEFEFYLLNAKQRATYLTTTHSYRAHMRFNDRNYWYIFNDKNEFMRVFKDFVKRESLDLRVDSFEDFKQFVAKHDRFFVKELAQYSGVGIDFYESKDIDDVQALYEKLNANNQMTIEEFFVQHEEMSKLSLKSVNTIRMITFVDDHRVPHLLVSALKSGTDNIYDNIGQGGMYTILSEEGRIIYPMIDQNNHTYEVHPLTKQKFIGFQVPHFDKAIEMVKKAALVVPEMRYIGWDVAIGPDGPEIIEGNDSSGPFQVIPSISKDKQGLLPLYESLMGSLRK